MAKVFKHTKTFGLVGVSGALILALLLASVVPAKAAKEKVVKIGMHGVYAGALATTGVPWGNSTMDYVRYINEQGGINGIQVECIWEETGRAPVVQGITTHKRFMERGVIAELSIISGACEVLAPVLQRDEIPMTLITALSPAMATKPPWVFSAEASMDDAGAVITTMIKEEFFPEKHLRLGFFNL